MNENIFNGNVYTKFFMRAIAQSPKFAPYLFYLHKRARMQYNLQCVIGEGGVGKDIWTICQNLILDPTFDITRIIYSTINLMDTLDTLEDRSLVGRCVQWSDAGVGLPSDEWFTASNRAMHAVIQTIRTLHPTVEFTTTFVENIDKKTRNVFSSILDCKLGSGRSTEIKIYTAKRMGVMADIVYRKFCFQQGVSKMRYGILKAEWLPEEYMKDVEILREYVRISDKFKFNTRAKVRDLKSVIDEKKWRTQGIEDYTTMTLKDFEKRLLYETYFKVMNEPRFFFNKSRRIDERQVMDNFHIEYKIARTIKRYFDARMTPEEVKADLQIEEPRAVETEAAQQKAQP